MLRVRCSAIAIWDTGFWFILLRKISESYETYLNSLLTPLGINSFKVTTFQENDFEENEVYYFGSDGDAPYIFTIAYRRDGDAGVVISAPVLLRFLCALDRYSLRPDILSPSSIELISQTPTLSSLGRGLGVWQEQELRFFTGSLPGNRSWMMIANNGHTATVLLNLRRTDIAQFDSDLQSLLFNIVKDGTIPWQSDLDQF